MSGQCQWALRRHLLLSSSPFVRVDGVVRVVVVVELEVVVVTVIVERCCCHMVMCQSFYYFYFLLVVEDTRKTRHMGRGLAGVRKLVPIPVPLCTRHKNPHGFPNP
jgi:hypothetical protein